MDIKSEAISLVKLEKTSWEMATAFVTEKVAFNMRNLIRQLRKNYWGVFDSPIDPDTGRKKIWIPLTEFLVEASVKNIDIDTKDVNFRAKPGANPQLALIVRNIVKNELDEMVFGEYLDEAERQLAIDGTCVWKTFQEKDEEGTYCARIQNVDLLNFYIDPTARSIKEANSVIERSVMTKDEFDSYADWVNKEDASVSKNVNRIDGEFNPTTAVNERGQTDMVEVYERWGKMPKRIITGKEEDKELIDGRIVVSATNGTWVFHYATKTDGKKPYEEAWYTRVSGRWYGKGIAEKVLMLQLWLNTIVNIRINRSYIAQLGIFKIKKGSGITPQMVSKLAANGAITVNSQDDIEQFVMQEASVASYKDESTIVDWGQKVTSAYETVTGEALPSSTPATNAVLQSKSAGSQFVFIKKGFGMFIQRWVKRQFLPIIQKNISIKDIVRISDDPETMKALDERIVNEAMYQQMSALQENNLVFNPSQAENERQAALARLKNSGLDRYITILHEIDLTEYDVQVYVTNEEMDTGVLTNNLITMLKLAPQYQDSIVQRIADITGLVGLKKQELPPPPATPGAMPGSANPLAAMMGGNTLQNAPANQANALAR